MHIFFQLCNYAHDFLCILFSILKNSLLALYIIQYCYRVIYSGELPLYYPPIAIILILFIHFISRFSLWKFYFKNTLFSVSWYQNVRMIILTWLYDLKAFLIGRGLLNSFYSYYWELTFQIVLVNYMIMYLCRLRVLRVSHDMSNHWCVWTYVGSMYLKCC